MARNERIVRYTKDEADELLRRGDDLTDYARFDAMTEAELEASIDVDEEGELDWSVVYVGLPPLPGWRRCSSTPTSSRGSRGKVRESGERINAVLRAHVEVQERQPADPARR
jgi:hypothetical protein